MHIISGKLGLDMGGVVLAAVGDDLQIDLGVLFVDDIDECAHVAERGLHRDDGCSPVSVLLSSPCE